MKFQQMQSQYSQESRDDGTSDHTNPYKSSLNETYLSGDLNLPKKITSNAETLFN